MVVVDDGQEWKVVDGARYCTGLAWRNDHLRTNRPLGICASLAAAHLVDVPQQVGRIFVDATRTGPLELVTAVATRQQPDAKVFRTRSPTVACRCRWTTIGLKVRARSKFHNIPRSMISCRIEPGYLFRESPKHFGNLTGVNASTSGRAPMGPRRALDPKPSAVAFG
jgi:hypothetical protein